MNKVKDVLIESAKFRIKKYKSEDGSFLGESQFEGNSLLNEGINELTKLIASASGTKWDNANAYLGVGDSAIATTADMTALQGASITYQGMATDFPTYGSSEKLTWKAVFGSDEANHSWQEFTVGNESTGGINLNRAVSDEGSKTGGQTWNLELVITFS